MKNEEILKKSIRKAVNSGWKIPSKNYLDLITDKEKLTEETWESIFDIMIRENRFQKFWFSHDFAKAFWGEEETIHCKYTYDSHYECDNLLEYEYQLQQMVLEENPISYLEQFIESDTKKKETRD